MKDIGSKATSTHTNQTLSQRVIEIQKSNLDINDLIAQYIPFIRSVASKVTGRSIQRDSDTMSVGLLAFTEAIEHYDASKGKFLVFSRWVIKRRIIDHIRKEARTSKEIYYEDIPEYEKYQLDKYSKEDDYSVDNPLAQEIAELSKILQKYSIAFEDLVLISPKATKTKKACAKAIQYIIDNPKIYEQMHRIKRIPIKEIEENCMIPRKLIERHRKYIVAVAEILTGDYLYLSEYVSFVEGGKAT